MKSAIFSVACMVGAVAAQGVGSVPSCAAPCLTKYTTGTEIAGCKQSDIKCICANEDFLNGIACCLTDACDAQGKQAAVEYAGKICGTAGVTVPKEVVCKKGSSSSSASGSAGAATTSASSATTASASGTKGTATSTPSPAAAAGLNSASGIMGALMAMLVAL